jgi:predicted PurR-regulated permease PerM
MSGDSPLKELVKEPIVYIIAVLAWVGADLVKNHNANDASWIVGVVLLIVSVISFLFKLIITVVDQNFRKKYTELLESQSKNITQQQNIIDSLALNTREAYNTMPSSNTKENISGGYSIPDETSTTTTGGK